MLNCFCTNAFEESGLRAASQVTKSPASGKSAAVCKEWFLDSIKTEVLGLAISIGINLVNTVLRYLMVNLLDHLRYDTKSAQMTAIKDGVLVTQFFNTGLLTLLSTTN